MNLHDELPPGIGPHEGREYELMVAGQKRVAFFSDIVPIEFVTNPSRLKLERIDHPELFGIIFYLKGFDDEASDLARLMLAALEARGEEAELERKIGRLLGYAEADIEAYVEHTSRQTGWRVRKGESR